MFEHRVRMRFVTDCGIASAATACGCTWEEAKRVEFGKAADGDWYWGIEQDAMAGVLRALTGKPARPSGSLLSDAKGSRGVVLVRVEREGAWADSRHWLAWEKDSSGVTYVYNPTDGEVFDARSLAGRGFSVLMHYSIGG